MAKLLGRRNMIYAEKKSKLSFNEDNPLQANIIRVRLRNIRKRNQKQDSDFFFQTVIILFFCRLPI